MIALCVQVQVVRPFVSSQQRCSPVPFLLLLLLCWVISHHSHLIVANLLFLWPLLRVFFAFGVLLFSLVEPLSRVWLFVTPWTAACHSSLSFSVSQSSLKLMSVESVMPSKHFILCHPLLLLPSIFLSIRVFSNESALHIRWPKYWSSSFNNSLPNEYSGSLSFWID